MKRRSGGPVAPLLALAAACGVLSPEEQLLRRYFEAARLHDTTVAAMFSTVPFNPRADGIVQDFEIQHVVDEENVKRVAVAADIRQPDGRVVTRTLAVTMQRDGDRWLISEIHGAR